MMKTIFTLLLLLLSLAGFSQLEDIGPNGISVGANIAHVKYKGNYSDTLTGNRIGLRIGAFRVIPLFGNLKLQPELDYSQTGDKIKTTDSSHSKLKLDYASIPLLLKYQLASGFSFYAGPEIDFLLNAKKTNTFSGTTSVVSVRNQYKSYLLSLPIGIDLTIPVGVVFSARYQFDLSGISNVTGRQARSYVASITMGYRF